jgi:hypothetical protein
MEVCVDVGEVSEGVGSVGIIEFEEAVETSVVVVPRGAVGDAEPFCATAAWNIKTGGMIKNLNRISDKIN